MTLVERLRRAAIRWKPLPVGRYCEEAADEIERLEAEGSALSAGVCPHLLGNEHGNAYCAKTNELI